MIFLTHFISFFTFLICGSTCELGKYYCMSIILNISLHSQTHFNDIPTFSISFQLIFTKNQIRNIILLSRTKPKNKRMVQPCYKNKRLLVLVSINLHFLPTAIEPFVSLAGAESRMTDSSPHGDGDDVQTGRRVAVTTPCRATKWVICQPQTMRFSLYRPH